METASIKEKNLMDIRQSTNYSKYMQSLGWQVEKIDRTNVFIRHLPVFSRWSVIKVQRPQKIDLEKLDKIAKEHHALFVKIEPDIGSSSSYQTTVSDGFKKDDWPLLPSKTLVLDLRNFNFGTLPKDVRYEIRKAQEKTVLVEKANDLELFYSLLKETMKIGKWDIPIHTEVNCLWKSFQPQNSQLLLPRQGTIPVGGCLLIWEGDKAHYMYAALTRQGRATSAAYLTLWNAIEFLKAKKINFLDLEGIYDERFPSFTKNWKGFTNFKKQWGGKEVQYEGSFVKYYNKLFQLLFRLF